MGALAHLRPDEPPGPGLAMRRRLVGFVATLRGAGFAIGRREVQDAALLLATPLADRPDALRAALKALFSSRHGDVARFDELFAAFWRGRGAKTMTKVTAQGLAARSPRRFETGPGAGGATDALPETNRRTRTRRAFRPTETGAKAAPARTKRSPAGTSGNSAANRTAARRKRSPNATPTRCACA